MSISNLLAARRFWPMFWTQFMGAFNDNVFKNALVILITFQAVKEGGLNTDQMVALCGGLFILPFFLFSATAGQLADRFPKAGLVRVIKAAEIGVMGLAALGFWLNSIPLLLGVLFLMGLQSAFFGPVKFGILPQLLREEELVGGNALVEMGTFLAILLGTIGGGLLISVDNGPLIVSGAVLCFALLGFLSSLFIPSQPAEAPTLRVRLNPITPTWQIFQQTRASRPIFLSVLGIGWFWFYGATILALFPTWCKDVLQGDPALVTFFLAVFSIGIGVGSLLCERLSGGKLELGLVPLGSIGMTIFALDLFFAGAPDIEAGTLISVSGFIATWTGLRISLDLLLLAVCGGFYIVPLNTLIQQRSPAAHRSRTVAGSNILSSFFMVISSLLLMLLYELGISVVQVFALVALLNLAVSVYIYLLIPEFLLRFVAWMLSHLLYRVHGRGLENIPEDGPAVIVCNHVTFVDWLLIGGACRRPVRFIMHHSFLKIPLAGWFFRGAKVIPIASAKESPHVLRAAFDQIAAELEAGQVVCIFPEGRLTPDGTLQPFQTGIERIVARNPVPVVPMALRGLWGSYFSRHRGRACTGNPLRMWGARVELVAAPPVPPEQVKAAVLQERVAQLLLKDGHPEAQREMVDAPGTA